MSKMPLAMVPQMRLSPCVYLPLHATQAITDTPVKNEDRMSKSEKNLSKWKKKKNPKPTFHNLHMHMLLVHTFLECSGWFSIFSASSSQACRPATVLLYLSQLAITSSSMLLTLLTSTERFLHWAVVSLMNFITFSTSSTKIQEIHWLFHFIAISVKVNFISCLFTLNKELYFTVASISVGFYIRMFSSQPNFSTRSWLRN